MEKHYPCSGQLDCQKRTPEIFITGVKFGNSNCCFCFMCLCLWISDISGIVLRQLVSSGLILLLWLVFSLALLISLEHWKWCETIMLLKGETVLPNIIILDNHCCSRIVLDPPDLKIAVLVAHCSLGLRSAKWILDLLECRWLKPSPWCKEAVVRERLTAVWCEQNREGKEDFSCQAGE